MIILLVSVASPGAFAQGYVAWNVSPAGDIIAMTNAANYSGLSGSLGGGSTTGQPGTTGNVSGPYYFELLYSIVDTTTPTTLAELAANWTATGLQLENNQGVNNGRLNELNPVSAAAIDPSYTGGNLQVMLVGWSANLGTAYGGSGGVLSELQNWSTTEVAGSAYFGMSFVGTAILSTSSSTGTTIWSATQTAGGLISNPSSSPMVLYELAVPEPGTMALAALGAASLFLFRRRK